jgi:FkbH-like protein
MMKEVSRLFYHHSQTKEDLERIKMYKQEQQRESQKDSFGNLDEYLSSLGIVIKIYKNDSSLIPRTAQMTQKTNQFNLTTQRYTENDIKQFIESPDYGVYVFEVSDKFGSYGITGLSIAKTNGNEAEFDSFLMSCRVLGRKIESSFLSYIIEDLKNNGIEKVASKYSKTAKNAQVEPFYDNNGFEVLQQNENEKQYRLQLDNWQAIYPEFITIELAESGVNA